MTTESGIYAFINTQNGKIYIGSAQNLNKREAAHLRSLRGQYHRNPYLQSAWNLYGSASFHFEILELVNDKSQLISREQFYLDKYKTFRRENGYNIRIVAGSNLGFKHSSKTQKKMSESKKGAKHPLFGKHRSKETREKISKTKKDKGIHAGKNNPMFGRRGTKSPFYKVCRSQITRDKISKGHRRRRERQEQESGQLHLF